MLTELPRALVNQIVLLLIVIIVLSGLMVWQTAEAMGQLNPYAPDLMFQLILASFVTLYGTSYFLRRSDVLGRLAGEHEALERLAYTDLLTGLNGRQRLNEHLDARTAQEAPFALLFVDVDSFKVVNDTLGHAAGDELLKHLARQLVQHSPPGSEVFRISGDEFVILLTPEHPPEETAQHLISQVASQYHEGLGVLTTLSIGVACYPADARTPAQLLRHADSAMYSAKQMGRRQVRRYRPELDAVNERHGQLTRELGHALTAGQFHLVFQPIYHLDTLRIVKVEALLRWHHPKLGYISPAEFIPVAERSGLILPIGEFVLGEVCRAAKQWPDLIVTMNVSPMQLNSEGFVQQLSAALQRNELAPQRIEVELTETALFHDPQRATFSTAALCDLGVGLSLDDFGSGYSNLLRLGSLPLTGVKLDRSIAEQLHDSRSRDFALAMIKATFLMTESLGVPLTAEGIENPDLVPELLSLGCTLGQGYGLNRPMTEQALSETLCKENADPHAHAPQNLGTV